MIEKFTKMIGNYPTATPLGWILLFCIAFIIVFILVHKFLPRGIIE